VDAKIQGNLKHQMEKHNRTPQCHRGRERKEGMFVHSKYKCSEQGWEKSTLLKRKDEERQEANVRND
jgi:hypothetical protein